MRPPPLSAARPGCEAAPADAPDNAAPLSVDRVRRQCLDRLTFAGLALAVPAWATRAAEPPEATPPAGAPAPAGMRPPALLLAETAPPNIDPTGWLVSEKLDGVRALWDGERLISRGGRVLAAPAAFTARLPAGVRMDGELWAGRGRFDAASATVRRLVPDASAWAALRYQVFEWPDAPGSFEQRVQALERLAAGGGGDTRDALWQPQAQRRLSDRAALLAWLAEVVTAGGEGLMLHRADAPYVVGRSALLLKLKPADDAEATVLAHEPGRGRLAGRVGALRVRDDEGRVFRVGSGLDDADRRAPPPVGSRITVRFQGRTPNGLPRFPTLLRRHEPI